TSVTADWNSESGQITTFHRSAKDSCTESDQCRERRGRAERPAESTGSLDYGQERTMNIMHLAIRSFVVSIALAGSLVWTSALASSGVADARCDGAPCDAS